MVGKACGINSSVTQKTNIASYRKLENHSEEGSGRQGQAGQNTNQIDKKAPANPKAKHKLVINPDKQAITAMPLMQTME